jgi:phosphate starvation-inducible PhoH-like protein
VTFSNVLTPEGWRPIGSLQVGDLVIGSNGEPTPVLGVYPQGEKDVYRVTAQDGSSTLCCGEHLWTVRTASDKRRNKPWRVLETQEMIGKLRAAHARRYELPMLTAPVCFPEREVPIDPYALGLLLGDGCITGKGTPSFSTADPELASALEASLPGVKVRSRGGYDYLVNRVSTSRDVGGGVLTHPLKEALRELELLGTRSNTKFIPDDYLYNSADVRLAVLQGLLDTDGGPVTQNDRTCRIQYATTSFMLQAQVTFLVESLGGVAYSRRRAKESFRPERANRQAIYHRRDAYVLDIRLPTGTEPFRLARKREMYRAAGGGGRPMRFIDQIEPVGREECVCIQVAAEDSLYVTEDFLLTHNTLNDAFIVLDEAQNTTLEQMKMFLTRLGFGSKVVVTGDVTQVDLPNGTRSGLRVVQEILGDLEDVHFSTLGSADVVRHRLVSEIVDAYERWDALQEAAAPRQVGGPGGQGHRNNRRR